MAILSVVVVFLVTSLVAASSLVVPRVQLDPTTRQFVSLEDGRAILFHGLAHENYGAPNELVTITDQYIALMKKVGHLSASSN